MLHILYLYLEIAKDKLSPGNIVAVYADPNYGGDPFWLVKITSVCAKKLVGVYLEKTRNLNVFNVGQQANIKFRSIVRPLKNLKRIYVLDVPFDDGYHLSTEVFNFLCNFCR